VEVLSDATTHQGDVPAIPRNRRRTSVLAIVLAGGRGRRLAPLTDDRAKPAVPFGGNYRIIDFVLSNLANAGYLRVVVLTQYKSHSLDRHVSQAWRLSASLGNYVAPVPAQMRLGPRWYAGSGDAIFQNLNLLYDERPDHVLVFGADHIYRMDPAQMVEMHADAGRDVTVAGIRIPRAEASAFGIILPGANGAISAFLEKPADPPGLPDAPDESLASMGNYVFRAEALIEAVTEDARDESSHHDLGGDIIPRLVADGRASWYDFLSNDVPGATPRDRGYWRDVGTVDAYYDAHMDLIAVHPIFNLYNRDWPIYSWHEPLPPAKFVFDDDGRRGQALDSMVSAGAIIAGGTVRRSVVSPGVVVEAGAHVEDSVLLHDVRVGPGAVIRRAILDKQVVVPAGATIGVDERADAERFDGRSGYCRTERGIVVVGKRRPVL
jgi:glucose-1-phosphate adenylyltransferase